jgi:pimeloyl-ACP methyl ester carboxylesterase
MCGPVRRAAGIRGSGWRGYALALGVCAVLGSGCLRFVNPIPPPPPAVQETNQSIPKEARDHVYIFFINGLDPVYLGNLIGLRDYVQSLGYSRTYFGQAFHALWFAREIRRLRQEDAEARIAVVGFSLGTNVGRGLAQALQEEGVSLDLLVCLSSNNLIDFSHERPANVARYIDILVQSQEVPPEDPFTERYNLLDCWHFGAPAHPATREVLQRELALLASSVPLPAAPLPPAPFGPEPLPAPRSLPTPPGQAAADSWDLLLPVPQLRTPPDVEPPADNSSEIP